MGRYGDTLFYILMGLLGEVWGGGGRFEEGIGVKKFLLARGAWTCFADALDAGGRERRLGRAGLGRGAKVRFAVKKI